MNQKTLLQIAGIGWVAGMRSMAGPALASTYLREHFIRRLLAQPAHALSARPAANLIRVMALGELIVDKLPYVPNRTDPPSLIGRTLSGALAGAALSAAHRERREVGALLGGLVAAVSTFVMFHVRTGITRNTSVPDLPVGLAEDAVIAAAYYNLQR